MTKRDFEMLASSIHATKLDTREYLGAGHVLKLVADRIASGCEDTNPLFDRQKFIAACGFPAVVDGKVVVRS